VYEWQESHINQSVTAKEMPVVLKKVWEMLDNKDIIKRSFRKCGLCPWDEEAIDFSRLPHPELQDETSQSSQGSVPDLDPGRVVLPNVPAVPKKSFRRFKFTVESDEHGNLQVAIPQEAKHLMAKGKIQMARVRKNNI
jgi:hypothetical protein